MADRRQGRLKLFWVICIQANGSGCVGFPRRARAECKRCIEAIERDWGHLDLSGLAPGVPPETAERLARYLRHSASPGAAVLDQPKRRPNA